MHVKRKHDSEAEGHSRGIRLDGVAVRYGRTRASPKLTAVPSAAEEMEARLRQRTPFCPMYNRPGAGSHSLPVVSRTHTTWI